jgi:hypothetical protein
LVCSFGQCCSTMSYNEQGESDVEAGDRSDDSDFDDDDEAVELDESSDENEDETDSEEVHVHVKHSKEQPETDDLEVEIRKQRTQWCGVEKQNILREVVRIGAAAHVGYTDADFLRDLVFASRAVAREQFFNVVETSVHTKETQALSSRIRDAFIAFHFCGLSLSES